MTLKVWIKKLVKAKNSIINVNKNNILESSEKIQNNDINKSLKNDSKFYKSDKNYQNSSKNQKQDSEELNQYSEISIQNSDIINKNLQIHQQDIQTQNQNLKSQNQNTQPQDSQVHTPSSKNQSHSIHPLNPPSPSNHSYSSLSLKKYLSPDPPPNPEFYIHKATSPSPSQLQTPQNPVSKPQKIAEPYFGNKTFTFQKSLSLIIKRLSLRLNEIFKKSSKNDIKFGIKCLYQINFVISN